MPQKNRRDSFAIAGVIACALIAIVTTALMRERRREPRETQLHSAPIASANSTAGGLPRALWPPVAAGSSATPAQSAPAGSATAEICGAGRVVVDRRDPIAVYAKLSKMTDARSSEWLKALLDSDDNRARAAGLTLQGKVAEGLQGQVMTDESRDALVQLAVGGTDPAVYAMAIYACHTDRTPIPDGECPQLSLSTWAQMDAGNAVPWLLLAQQARVRGNDAAAANAFAQAAKAQKVDSYIYSLLAYADADQPKDATPLEQAVFATQVNGIETAMRPLYTTAALRYCSEDAVRDDAVKQQCDAVANLLVGSTTVADFAIGIGLGRQSGWPPRRIDALNQEKFAMMEAQMQAGPIDNEPWSCNSVARLNSFFRKTLRLGELAASRDAVAQTGETPEALAKKLEQRMSKYAEDSPPSE